MWQWWRIHFQGFYSNLNNFWDSKTTNYTLYTICLLQSWRMRCRVLNEWTLYFHQLEMKVTVLPFLPPYTQEQNGSVERKNCTIFEAMWSLLNHSKFENVFCGKIVYIIVYWIKLWLKLNLQDKIPHEL